MKDLHQKLLAAFQVEHRDHVETVRQMLEIAEAAGWPDEQVDLVEAHRRMHSLKGASRAVGLTDLETLAHRLETVILQCQEGKLRLDEDLGAFLMASLDLIEDWVAALSGGDGAGPDILACIEKVDHVLHSPTPPEQSAVPLPPQPPSPPSPAEEEITLDHTEPPLKAPECKEGGFTPMETVRLEVARLDDLLRCALDVQAESLLQEQVAQTVSGLCKSIDQFARIFANSSSAAGGLNGHGTMKNEVAALVQQARKLQLQYSDQSWRLRRVGNRLQHSVREARMVPCEAVFGDYRRICRELAQSQGKQVSVRCVGLDTLADRRVLQEIKDPLLHLLRNAINHGLETAEEREAAGKPPAGHLELSIDATAGMLTMHVTDDGRGIDKPKVLQRARDMGLNIPEDEAALDSGALLNMISAPGMTTADDVSLVAGRGMGLSIVQETVGKLQGVLEISSAYNTGTAFTLSVPSTVTSKRVLFAVDDGRIHCIPAHQIDRLHRVTKESVTKVEGRLVFHPTKESAPIPIAKLSQFVGQSETSPLPDSDTLNLIVVKSGKARIALVAENLSDVRDVIINDIGGTGLKSHHASGAVMLQDGTVALVPNIAKLTEIFLERQSGPSVQFAVKDEEQSRKPSVLVVDDSITTRTLEKSILEANGYDVHLSVDGVDALENLRDLSVDLVVTDVEMPRLDGFGLLKALKQHQNLSGIPVILVTSRDDPSDRKRGLELGAHSYIVKQKFDQNNLLETINQVI